MGGYQGHRRRLNGRQAMNGANGIRAAATAALLGVVFLWGTAGSLAQDLDETGQPIEPPIVIDESITFSDPSQPDGFVPEIEVTPLAPPDVTADTVASDIDTDGSASAEADPEADAASWRATETPGALDEADANADDDPFAGMSCTPEEFAEVVDSAGTTLRAMIADRAPRFQAMLRVLKTRRGWDEQTFIREGRTYVEDDQIIAYDEMTAQLLAKINSLGSEDTSGGEPDCELLAELDGHLDQLVRTVDAKWQYMFARVERALTDE